LEKAENEVNSIKRRIALLQSELDDANTRSGEMGTKLEMVTNESNEIAEARAQLEENESSGDEKIANLEEGVKEAARLLEENLTKKVEAERKKVVVGRDVERESQKANTLEERVKVLEETINNATESLKTLEEREGESSMQEEKNEETVILLEGQLKDAVVRADAAERSCKVMERNITETDTEIANWEQKTKELEDEIAEMNDLDDA